MSKGRVRRKGKRHRPAKAVRDDRIVRTEQPGAPPGTLTVEEGSPIPVLHAICYGPERLVERSIGNVAELRPLLAEHAVTWLNVEGLGDVDLIRALGELFGLHNLTLEDIVHVDQRPKVERFPEYLFVVSRMFEQGERGFGSEQISMIIGQRFVITFQEREGDCLEPVRRRLRDHVGALRERGASYLSYAIIDAITDYLFPVLLERGDLLDTLEDEIMGHINDDVFGRIHGIKRELSTLKRVVDAQRELVERLGRLESPLIDDDTRLHLRDVVDHTEQLRELVSSYSDASGGLLDLHVSLSGHRMNEIMKVLTVVGTIFIPLTFITGLYGMNFDHNASSLNMPELHSAYGYPIVLAIMAVVTTGLLAFFVKKGWMG